VNFFKESASQEKRAAWDLTVGGKSHGWKEGLAQSVEKRGGWRCLRGVLKTGPSIWGAKREDVYKKSKGTKMTRRGQGEKTGAGENGVRYTKGGS